MQIIFKNILIVCCLIFWFSNEVQAEEPSIIQFPSVLSNDIGLWGSLERLPIGHVVTMVKTDNNEDKANKLNIFNIEIRKEKSKNLVKFGANLLTAFYIVENQLVIIDYCPFRVFRYGYENSNEIMILLYNLNSGVLEQRQQLAIPENMRNEITTSNQNEIRSVGVPKQYYVCFQPSRKGEWDVLMGRYPLDAFGNVWIIGAYRLPSRNASESSASPESTNIPQEPIPPSSPSTPVKPTENPPP